MRKILSPKYRKNKKWWFEKMPKYVTICDIYYKSVAPLEYVTLNFKKPRMRLQFFGKRGKIFRTAGQFLRSAGYIL